MGKFEKSWALRKTPAGALSKALEEVRLRATRRRTSATTWRAFLSAWTGTADDRGAGRGRRRIQLVSNGRKALGRRPRERGHRGPGDISTLREAALPPRRRRGLRQTFPSWCADRGLRRSSTSLFIDTSHLYEHTVRESPRLVSALGPAARVVFHDTNMKEAFVRRDGSSAPVGQRAGRHPGRRGAPGAVVSRRRGLHRIIPGWLVRHRASCNGSRFWTAYDHEGALSVAIITRNEGENLLDA